MAQAAPEPSAVLIVLDLVGIFVFAISGGLVAVRKDLDIFGVLALAGITGLGGGFTREGPPAPEPGGHQPYVPGSRRRIGQRPSTRSR